MDEVDKVDIFLGFDGNDNVDGSIFIDGVLNNRLYIIFTKYPKKYKLK